MVFKEFQAVLGLLVAAAVLAAAPVGAREVRVAVYQNPPKVFVDEAGEPQGIFVDLLQDCARRHAWTLTWVRGTWSEGLERARSGQVDLMPDVAWSDARSRVLRFSAEPVLSDWFQVYRRADVTIDSILDLEGRTVAVLRGSLPEQTLGVFSQQFGFNVNTLVRDDYEGAQGALAKGEAEAVVVNRFFGKFVSVPGIVATSVVLGPSKLYWAGPPGRGADLMLALDEYLRAVKADPGSVYYERLRRWTDERPAIPWPRWLGMAMALAVMAILVMLVLVLAFRRLSWRRGSELSSALTKVDEARIEALETEHIRIVGQMADGLAHDFNNILSPIVGYTDLLLAEPDMIADAAMVRTALEAVRLAGRDGTDIVRRFRNFKMGLTEAVPERADVNQVVIEAIRLAAPRWRRPKSAPGTVRVEEDLRPVPDVVVAAGEFRDAIVNLILNAVDALPRGGTIRVSTATEDSCTVVSVVDDGVGMSAETLGLCQRPFFSTKGKGGTGIGLAQVAAAADRAMGRVEVESELGRGTRVRLILPGLDGGDRRTAPPVEGEVSALRILAVDDDPLALAAMRLLVEADGHQVTMVEDGVAALKLLRPGGFDVVLSDRVMPGMTGDALVRALVSEGLKVPVVLVTGQLAGASPPPAGALVLSKPVTLGALRGALAAVTARGPAGSPPPASGQAVGSCGQVA